MLTLQQLRIGKIDGKHEYLTPVHERDREAFDAFMIPDSIVPDRMHNGDILFVKGFRGTGKTSFLRWHAESKRQSGAITDFVLFKTDLTEGQRLHLSKEVGISWVDIDSTTMEVSQDFKSAWVWFILHKIGENIKDNPAICSKSNDGFVAKAIRLLGLNDDSIFRKAIGFMPKLEGGSIKIRADAGFFEAELGGDFKKSGESGETTLDALSKRVIHAFSGINYDKPIYLYFDELEAFYHTPEQHIRDLRMVRDLLFSVSLINDAFRKKNIPVHIFAAVRSEIIDNMGALGQEVDRLVHDKGFHISWHHANRSLNHPLMQIIKRKIQASERAEGMEPSSDPISKYFPAHVNNDSIESFMLDKSFYKPRDIVWRLSIAQKLFPNEKKFSVNVLRDTETEYSKKLWDEIRYELSATYSEIEINSIESVFSGGSSAFDLSHIEERFQKLTNYSSTMVKLLSRKSVRDILDDLYRLGAIGNSFRAGATGTDIKNRWSFRGEINLLVEKRMVIHPALCKRLSVVEARKRGSRKDR